MKVFYVLMIVLNVYNIISGIAFTAERHWWGPISITLGLACGCWFTYMLVQAL